jgi:hypothetical protein
MRTSASSCTVELLHVCVDLGEVELRCKFPDPGWRPVGSLLAFFGARAAGGRRSPPPASRAAVEEKELTLKSR